LERIVGLVVSRATKGQPMTHDDPVTKPTVLNVNRERFANALGNAVLACWGQLSQKTQHMLFETAVMCGHHDERDESLRSQLAEYLHDHHPKTDK
jgi:hypothetical protein